MKNTIIVPSYNPDEKLIDVVNGLVNRGFDDILVVDDGSDNNHKEPFKIVKEIKGVTLLVHEVNKGKGRALKTAFEYFLANRRGYSGVITVDGDNQHKAEDVERCLDLMNREDVLVLGVRDFSKDDIPARSKFGNNLTSGIFKTFCHLKITDTQTGLRAIPTRFIKPLLEVSGERYEYETNMLLAMKSLEIPFKELSIQTVYIDDNESSHFNPIKDSIKIYKVIFAYFFRSKAFKYTLSSITSWMIDNILFNLISFLLLGILVVDARILIATATARICSSIYNYLVNKNLVFNSKNNGIKTFVRYYILWLIILCCSFVIVDVFVRILNLNSFFTGLCKIIVDLCLFLASYQVQKQWVFKKEEVNGECINE